MGREELYRQFGPKLIEALARVVMDEVNILRQEHGKPDRTLAQMASAIESKLAAIPDYTWQDTQP